MTPTFIAFTCYVAVWVAAIVGLLSLLHYAMERTEAALYRRQFRNRNAMRAKLRDRTFISIQG